MSLDPRIPLSVAPPPPEGLPAAQGYHWYHKLSAFIFILFCMEVGAFLILFPWTKWWDRNFFSALIPEWHRFWEDSYVRGAVSGLGVIDLYISLLEIVRLRRFARRG